MPPQDDSQELGQLADGEVSGSHMSLKRKNKLLEFAFSWLPKNKRNIKVIHKEPS